MTRPRKKPPTISGPTRKQMRSLLSPYQVATYLGLTTRRVIQMIGDEEIAAKRFGRCGWLLEQKEVMRVYNARRAEGGRVP